MEVPITINKIKADGYNIKIEEKIKFIDFMKQRKFGDKEIDELAEDAVDSMLPNSSPEDKERAKKNYLERTKIKELDAMVFSFSSNDEDKYTNIVLGSNRLMKRILGYLQIKENMSINLISSLGIPIEDFLLWLYWRSLTKEEMSGLVIRNIIKDGTGDTLEGRTQTEKGGNNVIDSFDLRYRVGIGLPLKSMVLIMNEVNIGAKLDIGIFMEDNDGPFTTISEFNPYKSLRESLETTKDYDINSEIYKKGLAIDIIYRLIAEYKNDSKSWSTEKPKFIKTQAKEASEKLGI